MFHIGQKVVCVEDRCQHPLQRMVVPAWPVRGRIYTVRGVKQNGGVVVEELVNPPIPDHGEPHFHRMRFRPVQERSTGMEVLTGILRGADPQGPEGPVRAPERTPEEVGG